MARENEDIADEELDALLGGEKVKPKKAEKVTAKEETLGKGVSYHSPFASQASSCLTVQIDRRQGRAGEEEEKEEEEERQA